MKDENRRFNVQCSVSRTCRGSPSAYQSLNLQIPSSPLYAFLSIPMPFLSTFYRISIHFLSRIRETLPLITCRFPREYRETRGRRGPKKIFSVGATLASSSPAAAQSCKSKKSGRFMHVSHEGDFTARAAILSKSPLLPPRNSGKLPPAPAVGLARVVVSAFVPMSYLLDRERREGAVYAARLPIHGSQAVFLSIILLAMEARAFRIEIRPRFPQLQTEGV